MSERLTRSLQESVLTLIAMDDTKGGIAARMIASVLDEVKLFTKPYDDIVTKAISYHNKYKKAPGKAHLDDLFDHILSDPDHKQHRVYENAMSGILDLADNLNADYILNRVNDFIRRQNLYDSVIKVVERFQQGGDNDLADAEHILGSALKYKPTDIAKGHYLSDKISIQNLVNQNTCDFKLGITPFDARQIGLTRKEVLAYMSPTGKGKTWFCVNSGVEIAKQGGRVMHISLENSFERLGPRYLRRLFAIAKTRDKYRQTRFEFDELGRVVDWKSELTRARLAISDKDIEKQVAKRMDNVSRILNRIHVKTFAMSSLSYEGLVSYIDNIEETDGFIPDVIIIDGPKLMKLDRRQDLRLALGLMWERLRGLLDERNAAGIFTLQSNRGGEDAKLLTRKDIGEDYSVGQTADQLLTYSQTKAEKVLDLARLRADKGRDAKDGFEVLISQDYETGQFCKQAAYMPHNYFDMVKSNGNDEEDDE